ncbi:hypothetical protein F511_22113 [Dorcoceras hygrometricum]|uniref:Protein kinase domain-containing protein n=1 Tax=Dorcoceras hygrometricum TaxID=472368 RepID=A0A2Z7ACK9_9LAMI|nr:hypothetical protein F511_22113 [Dorcoceras hygrometricum]
MQGSTKKCHVLVTIVHEGTSRGSLSLCNCCCELEEPVEGATRRRFDKLKRCVSRFAPSTSRERLLCDMRCDWMTSRCVEPIKSNAIIGVVTAKCERLPLGCDGLTGPDDHGPMISRLIHRGIETVINNDMNAKERATEKKVIPFSPTRGFCRRLSDCVIMGPASSTAHHIPRRTTHLPQVEELHKELAKEKELKSMYKMRLQRTQSFLNYCQQLAQDNGFFNLILNKHKADSPSPSLPSTEQVPHPPLAALVNQARINGWYIHPEEIEIHHLSAQGTTADIYKGRWRGIDVAIKCMYPDFFQSNDNGVSFFAQEVETLSSQRHPFVLQLMGRALILRIDVGSHKERTIPLPPLKDRLAKALEIAQAMQYLHESKPKIVHRDLKPSNIFLDDALHVRVADFGHARFLSDGEKAMTGETGTFIYMAPEVISCSAYDEKCDIYSFGVILNELVSGEYPYIDTDYGPSKIALEVAQNGLRPSIAKAETNIIDLIQQLWDQEPAGRPSFNEITYNLRNILGDNKFE